MPPRKPTPANVPGKKNSFVQGAGPAGHSRKALLCGVSGQDGAYLSRILLEHGYEVWGSSRDAAVTEFSNLRELGIRDQVKTLSLQPTDFRSVLQAITRIQPDEIYNLSGQSSVGLSFEQPVETFESITVGTMNFLEAIRFSNPKIRFYNASSGECFGNLHGEAAVEATPFRPRSPYAVAKAAAFWAVSNYREAYNLFACSGILFNHESPLRPNRFVTRKIMSTACRIAKGSKETLQLGNLSIKRDWGWAPEYAEAMRLMMQFERPEDFVIATGELHSLEEFTARTFQAFDLDWRKHVETDPGLLRPIDLEGGCGNAFKAHSLLGWKPTVTFTRLIERLAEAERTRP